MRANKPAATSYQHGFVRHVLGASKKSGGSENGTIYISDAMHFLEDSSMLLARQQSWDIMSPKTTLVRINMNRPTSLCVVSPCFNEALVIEKFYAAVKKVLETTGLDYRILLVDDGSTDATLEKLNALALKDARVLPYSLSRNFGHQLALKAGLEAADADLVIMMDSDLQHPPDLIPKMISEWRAGYDIVSAVRHTTAGASMFKRASSRLFYFFLGLISETSVSAGAADFCLLSRRALEALNSMPERHLFLRGMVSWVGFKRAFVMYDAAERGGGKSKYSLKKMLVLSLDAIFSFSVVPIRLAMYVGLPVIVLSMVYFTYAVGRAIFLGDQVKGWTSLICVVLFLGGTQLTFIGLLGEYLGRIYDQVKARPRYFFKHTPADALEMRQTFSEVANFRSAAQGKS